MYILDSDSILTAEVTRGQSASLSCPVREEREGVDADLQETIDEGSTIPVFLGHSIECWTTPPMRQTPEIKAACPKCSAPELAASAGARDRRAAYDATAAMEQSVGWRSGQR